MLYVVMKNDRGAEWHIGEKNPVLQEEIWQVEELQADCDELEWIRSSFQNLPIHNRARVQRWFGDQAKFIASVLGR